MEKYNWKITKRRSSIIFKVKYYKIGSISGRFRKFNGTILASEHFDHPEIDFCIGVNSVETLNKFWNKKLLSTEFLASDLYPFIYFTANESCVLRSGAVREFTGSLIIRDKAHPLTFIVTSITPKKKNKVRAISFTLAASLSVWDFGYVPTDNIIGDEIILEAGITLQRIENR